jgi:hypothetical protein
MKRAIFCGLAAGLVMVVANGIATFAVVRGVGGLGVSPWQGIVMVLVNGAAVAVAFGAVHLLAAWRAGWVIQPSWVGLSIPWLRGNRTVDNRNLAREFGFGFVGGGVAVLGLLLSSLLVSAIGGGPSTTSATIASRGWLATLLAALGMTLIFAVTTGNVAALQAPVEIESLGGPLELLAADRRLALGRGIPALPLDKHANRPGAPVREGVVQHANYRTVALLAGISEGTCRHNGRLLAEAGDELGFEPGGLDTPVSQWPPGGAPWRTRLDPVALWEEVYHLRTAAWIVIAGLSGMRDVEVRELRRDCAFTEPADDDRTRYKIRGRVYKGRSLSGDQADWVVLEVVHQAVQVLLEINDDPTHLFGYRKGEQLGYRLLSVMPARMNRFRDHLNELFGTPEAPYIPDGTGDGATGTPDRGQPQGAPWAFNTRQFRQSLAWHIAHQPFGVVAGTRQYKHARHVIFSGYAGTSASGFAAEVAAEEATARLDYAEDLYRDWNSGGSSAGAAGKRVDAEFARIRRELGDLPGIIASPARLRTMLAHLVKTLHPGILNDCFYQPATALCRKQAKTLGRPLPLLNTCLDCPNARRSAIHLPRLAAARDQAARFLDPAPPDGPLAPLQQLALDSHVATLDRAIGELQADATGTGAW